MIRIEIEQDGEWVPVDGVRSVELQQSEVTPAPGDREARINAAMERICRSMHRAIRDALRIPVEPTRRRQEQPEPPAPLTLPMRRDRPAWQSPYGPPPRRR
ncbi:hypothetical protein [Streptomyces rubiginosohelvolus]|uniref:Uncharacterized protein n=1 Tax=Streptomyces rubiginosohelvolus TaxID=67362 RepID=A0ABQ3BMI4_9ACTN|nr:hypothetical protein [Streptomyces pluricolorescens]GGZ51586.1 hypothetical protein GCM10010328_27800 [Streptomyces pluricolorescens]